MKTKRIIKDQKGGALVEFAIVLPLLVLLFAGIFELSIGFYNWQVITNASREGARAGINGIDTDEIPDPDSYLIDKINVYCFGEDIDDDGYGDSPRLITFGGTGISAFSGCGSPPCIEINDGSGFLNGSPDLKISIDYVYTLAFSSIVGFGPSVTLHGQTVMNMF